jgi:hypothetical protein
MRMFRLRDRGERSVETMTMTIRRNGSRWLRASLPAFAGLRGITAGSRGAMRSGTGLTVRGVAGDGEQDNGGRVSATGSAM